MRVIYLFIVLFLAWCVICARWYMFSVKGLSTDPLHFDPHETTLAIVEILFMVLVAFLLGFAIAWLLRETGYAQKQAVIHKLQSANLVLQNTHSDQKDHLRKKELDLVQIREDFVEASRENEKLKTELEDSIEEGSQLQSELDMLQPKVQQYYSELGLLRFRVKQYEQQTIEKQEAFQNLQAELEESKAQRRFERREPVFSDFISDQILPGVSPEDVNEDDLKEIAGIGPAIEKKLNSLGINSFKQISELTEVSSKQISHAIKFFPGRIERDRWVEQASRLYLEKLRK
jgi:predicted flap endonuclease-1-like 5' DNA nuclease